MYLMFFNNISGIFDPIKIYDGAILRKTVDGENLSHISAVKLHHKRS